MLTLAPRRAVLALLGFACLPPASAQAWPARPVRLVVHNNPGSALDIVAREVAIRLGAALGQSVVIENRPGAGGIAGTDVVAKAPPDGYTLLVAGDGPVTIMPSLGVALPYDPRRDLLPVASLAEIDFVLVAHAKTGFRTLRDLVDAARRQPGRYNYASAGNGSPQNLAAEMLKQAAGIHLTHIPYGGGPAGLNGVLAQDVDAMFIAVAPALQHIQGGRLVALATSGDARDPLLPAVPTVGETYQGFRARTWFGLFAPGATPAAVVQRLGAAVDGALADGALRGALAAQGIRVTGDGQERFRSAIDAEARRYAAIVKAARIRAD